MNAEDRKYNIMVVGGCHVAGYLLNSQPSFVDIINQGVEPSSLIKKSNFQLKNVRQLEHLFSHYSSDVIILQLGNTEFAPSFKDILRINTKKKKREGEGALAQISTRFANAIFL